MFPKVNREALPVVGHFETWLVNLAESKVKADGKDQEQDDPEHGTVDSDNVEPIRLVIAAVLHGNRKSDSYRPAKRCKERQNAAEHATHIAFHATALSALRCS